MIAALFGVGVLTGGEDEEAAGPDAPAAAEVERVARGVERVRGLEFKRLPPVRSLEADAARAEALELLDAEYPPERRGADEEVLELLGLIPAGTDLRELLGTIFGEQVAGYYDQRNGRMTLVADGGAGDELTLAHELTHALEDQHFGLDAGEAELDDAATARQALYEGTATVAMLDYARPDADRTAALASLDLAGLFVSSRELPAYIQRALLFPYVAGARFVDAIGTWGPANRALRSRPPRSTEQVIHPAKYRAGEPPLAVDAGRPRGAGWRRAGSGTIGEFDTRELIRTSDSAARAERAAAGWGGGAYSLWRRGGESELHLAWRWDSARDAAEFAAALPRYIELTLGGRSAGAGLWRTRGERSVRVRAGAVVRLRIGAGER